MELNRSSGRFIPAHAGNTVSQNLRGTGINGLSPLTRGTLCPATQHAIKKRFIPAHAGNTATALPNSWINSVYPRSRGEHGDMLANSEPPSGLSPLTRGTLLDLCNPQQQIRFIPAHAGNTNNNTPLAPEDAVYSRSRGEHSTKALRNWLISGLSPLTRGTHSRERPRMSACRFIPAHAGNTSSSSSLSPDFIGLSPLTRGTRWFNSKPDADYRFIPAHAGNTCA
ncbi:hypothetical protein BN439_0609 [Erwinia amylovora Ea644]|nr:hypothetical protein BN439_0609 [Erwinia amylovora Ea644]